MNSSNVPNSNELPSKGQLFKSTIIALVTAVVILVTTILPAEYGIDPTGLGRAFGLTQMGEIKVSLAEEAVQVQGPVIVVPAEVQAAVVKPVPQAAAAIEPAKPLVNSDQRVIILQPGEAAELKLAMNQGEKVEYQWSVEGGTANFDTHGDAPGINYHGYGKGRFVEGDAGILEAAFDGKHGWFWRNRSETEVTITLLINGEYTDIVRVL